MYHNSLISYLLICAHVLICQGAWVRTWRGQFQWEKSLMLFTVLSGMRGMAHHAEPPGEDAELVMRQNRSKGKSMDCSHHWGFWGKQEAGRVNSIRLVSSNNFIGLWGRVNAGLVCESSVKELVGGMDLGLVDLYIKGVFVGKLFILGISWLGRGSLSLASKVLKCQKYYDVENTNTLFTHLYTHTYTHTHSQVGSILLV